MFDVVNAIVLLLFVSFQ